MFLQIVVQGELGGMGLAGYQFIGGTILGNDEVDQTLGEHATCNPYYAYAAILMAGLDGVKKGIDPHKMGWGPFDCNLFDLPEEEKAKLGGLPASLTEAANALEQDHDYLTAGGVFPQRLIDLIIAKDRAADEMVSRKPHPAEFALYYDL